MLKWLKNSFKALIEKKFNKIERKQEQLRQQLEETLIQNGRIWTAMLPDQKITNIHNVEFKVFSQWGDDGIIQYLIKYLEIKREIFIEFGVEDYKESNTRFLLLNNNWSGLVMDGSKSNIEKIKEDNFYWKHDLIAKQAFITRENINDLIEEEGIGGEIGLLHIDIDGNDYWVWQALKIVEPIILIIEYNSLFGKTKAITIPYQENFNWTKAHYSNLYFGASIPAFVDLANEKGYAFIGCNKAGNNAYFIKNEYKKGLMRLSAEDGFVESKFRQSRDKSGNLNYLNVKNREFEIKGLPVFNIRSGRIEKF